MMWCTDDVVWLWAIGDLLEKGKLSDEDILWAYELTHQFFDTFYSKFYDENDGLYKCQACFVDAGDNKSGYPMGSTQKEQIYSKHLSTNALYVKGLQVMGDLCEHLGKKDEAVKWFEQADKLKKVIRATFVQKDGRCLHVKNSFGETTTRQHCLSIAFAILLDILTAEEAKNAVKDYPITDIGIPLFHPFYDNGRGYHNNVSWPFSDTFYLKAYEKATGEDMTALNAALLARTCVNDGTFHEVVSFKNGESGGSGSQLWTAAGFIDVCKRANLINNTK